jgi:hypothetical protein
MAAATLEAMCSGMPTTSITKTVGPLPAAKCFLEFLLSPNFNAVLLLLA